MKLHMVYLAICLITLILNLILSWRLISRNGCRRGKTAAGSEEVITFRLEHSGGICGDTTETIPIDEKMAHQ